MPLPFTLAACLLVLLALPGAAAAQPLATAVYDHFEYRSPERDTAFEHVRDAGASVARLNVSWSEIAPDGTFNEDDGTTDRPENFEARDPLDPAYAFDALDKQVIAAAAHGLEPFVTIVHAPGWAERGDVGRFGTRNPDPDDVEDFAVALARRYSGTMLGLPRVRYWHVWNEPNLHVFLMPQFEEPYRDNIQGDGTAVSPALYRNLVKAVSRGVYGVDPTNRVIAGGLAPFGRPFGFRHAVAPLRFMRDFLCLTDKGRRKPGCNPAPFDIWSTHPYTEGGPNHSAALADNVSMGDLPEMRKTLRRADRLGQIRSHGNVQFWVTEFSWETKPPDNNGVPTKLHSRWVAEALYRMWQNGISLVTWFKIRDETEPDPSNGQIFQSGLHRNCGANCYRAKRSLRAFEFPFVAFRKGKRVKVWGRTPSAAAGTVLIEQRRKGGGWRDLKELRANEDGIFRARPRRRGRGPVRASVAEPARQRALPFALKKTRDIPVRLFG